MDRDNWVCDGWEFIKKYRKLGEEERGIANSLSIFVLEHLSVDKS
jgi:hypothetical protein